MTAEMDTIQDGLSGMTTEVAELLDVPEMDAQMICLLALAKQVLASYGEKVDARDGSTYVTGAFTRKYPNLLEAFVHEAAGANCEIKKIMHDLST